MWKLKQEIQIETSFTIQSFKTDHTLVLILFPPSSCTVTNAFLTKIARIPTVRRTRVYLSALFIGGVEEALNEGRVELKATTIPIRERQLRASASSRSRGEELRKLNQISINQNVSVFMYVESV